MRFYKSALTGHRISQGGKTIGRLQDIIIDPETGRVVGLKTKQQTLPAIKLVSWQPLQIGPDYQVLKTAFNSLDGRSVMTEAGVDIGIVDDIQIDTDQLMLSQIVVKPRSKIISLLFDNERMFSFGQIKEIADDRIIVSDNQEKVNIEPVATPA